MKNSIWITGASGQLGTEIVKLLKANTENRVVATDISDVDITDSLQVERAADLYRPTVIINCASISNIAYCEDHMVEAFKVNALGARNLANISRKLNAKIIQLSTDDVFSCSSVSAMTEFDTPNPVTVYGKSKLAGENYVRELNPKHLIVRSSWVYGAGDKHFFAFVEEMAKKGEPFTVPSYKVSSPTSSSTLADFICSLVDKSEYGIIHASCEGSCTRLEFARAILEGLSYDTNLAVEETSPDGQVKSTLLENLMLKMTEIYEMPDWQTDLKDYIANR
ncbi:MAG: NAD(P)-dependent oxidoreductase [Clostridia bacterium]|nr:NAD(P)-dependent oxidoreductase [Clostridia bacterium]